MFITCRHACQLSETKNDGSTGSARERHGLFRCGAFQAARIRRPSIQYSRVVLPPGPNSWPLNIQPLVQFQPAPRLSAGPIRIVQECGPLATYRGMPGSTFAMWASAGPCRVVPCAVTRTHALQQMPRFAERDLWNIGLLIRPTA